jgi:hypothetical protein
MIFKQIETPGLELVSIKARPEWVITCHRLFNVSPENADKVEVKGARVTVWDLCFFQDLLQIVNASRVCCWMWAGIPMPILRGHFVFA